MKKYLLFLMLVVVAFGYSQVNSQVTNYQICNSGNNGSATFDLTSKNGEILANLNSAEHTITFYETVQDSEVPINAIDNSQSYTNISNPQTIYVRVTNTTTTQTEYTSFQLLVSPLPTANPATLLWCDPMELPIFNLQTAIPQIIGTQANANTTVSFHLTTGDAQLNLNPASDGGFPPQGLPQVLFVRVTNVLTGCVAFTTLTLDSCPQPVCAAPINLTASSQTSFSCVLGWTTSAPSSYSAIYVTLAGAPAPLPNTTWSAYAQVNPFVYTGLVPDTCYAFYVKTFCDSGSTGSEWSAPHNFCLYSCENNGQCPESLVLSAFIDANNNGIKDSGELAFNNGSFEYEINNSGTVFHGNSNNGNFTIFESNPANSYDLNFAVNPELAAYYNATTTYSNITVPFGSGSHTYNFPVTELQPFNDLEIHVTPYGAPPRPGFNYLNWIVYKNKAATTVPTGTINFVKDPSATIVSVSESGVINSATGFSYTFSNLAPGEQRYLQVEMQTPTIPTIQLGAVFTNSASIEPIVGDAFPNNNSASLSQIVVGSYDPNEKSETHGGKIGMDTFTTDNYLTYTIQFENTGSANAEFIRVEDVLEAGLDANSIVMLHSSHNYNLRRNGNHLVWHFYNINLSTTSANPSLSHGYIQFKVKPSAGFDVGTLIQNSASIYFDYNPPIVTEICQTEFVETLRTVGFDIGAFYISPNPSHSMVEIRLNNSNQSIKKIEIQDVLGKTIPVVEAFHSNQATLNVSQLTKGLYFVSVSTDSNQKVTKKLMIN